MNFMNALSITYKVTVMCLDASTEVLCGALAPLWDFDVTYIFTLNNFFKSNHKFPQNQK